MGVSPCSFLRRRITFSCLVERVKQRQADVKVSFPTFNTALVVTRGGLRPFSRASFRAHMYLSPKPRTIG